MIALIDYNVGNLFSVKNALEYVGEESVITRDRVEVEKADAIIIPGVGAFPDAMRELEKTGLVQIIKEQAKVKPLLGICLGMQLLFEKSYEFEECPGLGLIDGEVKLIPAEGLKIPHMGWNALRYKNPCTMLEGVEEGKYVYFVHSYMAFTREENIAAYVEYGAQVPALVHKGNVYGAQFHPEKSSEPGLMMLKNFCKLTK